MLRQERRGVGPSKLTELAIDRLPWELRPQFTITPRVLRRTFACLHAINYEMGSNGWGLRTLQRAMGHSSLETTALYLADVEHYTHQRRETTSVRAIAAAHTGLGNPTVDRAREEQAPGVAAA